MNRTTLFGGALFSAGLAAGAVTQPVSADFSFTNGQGNYSWIAILQGYDFEIYQLNIAFGPAYVGYDYYHGQAIDTTVWINPDSMGLTNYRVHNYDNYGHSYTRAGAYFQVTEDTTIQFDWQFAEWGYGSISVTDLSGGGADFLAYSNDGNNAEPGSHTLSLTAGDEYYFHAAIDTFYFGYPAGHGFATMTIIPAPAAALPLLAAGGLLTVSRRRRRE